MIRHRAARVVCALLFLGIIPQQGDPADGREVILLTRDRGLLRSVDGGRYSDFNAGLPAAIVAEKIYRDRSNTLYLAAKDAGLFRYRRSEGRWAAIHSSDFRRRSQRSDGGDPGFRTISAFAVSHDGQTLIAATKHTLYRSTDAAATWERVPFSGGLNERCYITATALHGKRLYAGTSFDGLYQKSAGAFSFLAAGLPCEYYSGGVRFYEEIAAVAVDPGNPDTIYAGINFGGGVFVSRNGGRSWTNCDLPLPAGSFAMISDLSVSASHVYAATGAGVFAMDRATNRWIAISAFDDIVRAASRQSDVLAVFIGGAADDIGLSVGIRRPCPVQDAGRIQRASSRRAIYAGLGALKKNTDGLIATIRATGLNAVVIDVKDDMGGILFPSDNPVARKIGAVRRSDIRPYLNKFRDAGIYTIARQVVFKDMQLFQAYNGKYAIWNYRHGCPWKGAEHEYWVDPHAALVRRYNVDISAEIATLGFDEIQYDYIRFPSDGPVHLCSFRHRTEKDIYKSEILADFLREARQRIKLPISVDIYGFNIMYHFGNRIGQDAAEFAEIVDVLCPMVYPSHFGGRFFSRIPHARRPYAIVYASGKRGAAMLCPQAINRPYLQAFNLLSPTWGPGYITAQTDAARDGGCSGFTFWNAGGDYLMLRRALAE